MANNSVVTQEVLQNTLENYHENFVYPYLNGATHTGFTPVGTVISYFGETAPEYFLICDGTEYAKSDYPQLADLLLNLTDPTPFEGSDANHFKVPDLRGEFLRGTGTNGHTDQGSGANVGVHQDATVIPTTLTANDAIYFRKDTESTFYQASNTDKKIVGNMKQLPVSSSAQSDVEAEYGFAARPTNTSVLYCIAYKNIYIDLALDSFPLGISNPTDGQALVWNATEGRWKNAGILHEYSTDEKVVGTWIDGKPLYERVIVTTLNVLPTERTWYPIADLPNVDKYVSFNGMISDFQTLGYFRTAPYSDATNDAYFSIAGLNASFTQSPGRIQLLGKNINIGTVYITVRYTKTTD